MADGETISPERRQAEIDARIANLLASAEKGYVEAKWHPLRVGASLFTAGAAVGSFLLAAGMAIASFFF